MAEYAEVDADYLTHTDRAVCIEFFDRHGRQEIWIPRSQCGNDWDELDDLSRNESHQFYVAEWLANKKGLI